MPVHNATAPASASWIIPLRVARQDEPVLVNKVSNIVLDNRRVYSDASGGLRYNAVTATHLSRARDKLQERVKDEVGEVLP